MFSQVASARSSWQASFKLAGGNFLKPTKSNPLFQHNNTNEEFVVESEPTMVSTRAHPDPPAPAEGAAAAATAAATEDGEPPQQQPEDPQKPDEEMPDLPHSVTNEDGTPSKQPSTDVAAAEREDQEHGEEMVDDIVNSSDEEDGHEEDLVGEPQSKRQRTVDNESEAAAAAAALSALEEREGGTTSESNAEPPGQEMEGPAGAAAASGSGDVVDMDVVDNATEAAAVAAPAAADQNVNDDEEEIQVMSPPRVAAAAATKVPGNGNAADDDDDEIQIESCNCTNPGVAFIHSRQDCGVHKFDPSGANAEQNKRCCEKCFCFVCDVVAADCDEWDRHCHAKSTDVVWQNERQRKKRGSAAAAAAAAAAPDDVITIDDNSPIAAAAAASAGTARRQIRRANVGTYQEEQQRRARERMEVLANIMGSSDASMALPGGGEGGGGRRSSTSSTSATATEMINALVAEQLGAAVNAGSSAYDRDGRERGERREKARDVMRITEVLSENFKKALSLSVARGTSSAAAATAGVSSGQSHRKMEGDIPQLGLHSAFFVEGIKIGWPYPMVMPPQRQMAIHLIKALKNQRHVVLESPTGTGKSAAILCAVLAWQRYHAKTAEGRSGSETPRIIYCSRTHSQVAQMVASLKKTPYRPRMAILGSRERMCIHKDLRPRAGAEKVSGNINVNNECRARVRNTEKYRKTMWRSEVKGYDDDDPPVDVTGDRAADATQQQGETAGDNDDDNGDGFRSKNRKMCPHYRQLSTNRIAALAHSMFTPNESAVSCCSLGGEKTKFGAHDIEDLVAFGVTPHTLSGVSIYRGDTTSVGLQLSALPESGCCVGKVKEGAAKVEGTLREGDMITKLNGEDVRGLPLPQVASKFRGATEDPIMIDVMRGEDRTLDDEDYSSHAACPYYLSQILSKNAELVFAPYNYVLEPAIRNALGISLEGSIIVLDEAHNVEDTLRESGSCKLPEFELCELLLVLSNYSTMEKHHSNLIKVSLPGVQVPSSHGEDGNIPESSMYISDVAHTILLFLERFIEFLRSSRDRFEKNPGNKGADYAIKEWRKYHSPDDKEFEVTYDGPTGHGLGGKAVGCKTFFDKLQIAQNDLYTVLSYTEALAEHVRGGDDQDNEQRSMNQMDRLMELVVKFAAACQKPEHYYIASVVSPNGTFSHAAGEEDDSNENSRFKKKPKQLPYAPPRTQAYPNRPVNPCGHQTCRQRSAGNAFNVVRHGSFCNGSTPKWEASLVLNLLSPGLPMRELADQCRTVVLASGSLAPLPSLCGELNLFPPKENAQLSNSSSNTVDVKPAAKTNSDASAVDLERYGRLQVHPRPLEANHVINLQKQLLAVSIGHFPDGSPLSVKYSTYSKPDFVPKLGDAIASIIESIPSGGVLVFLPSYSFLRKCVNAWNPYASRRGRFRFSGSQNDSDVWDRIIESKGKIIVEETGSQEKFELSRNEYNETIRSYGSCVLFAVYRGKMSEGVSFNDDYARGVICVGIPLPNAYDMSIRSKKNYNNEQRRLKNRQNLLPGDEWYQQQAYRAIAQALGRCIRHAGDYGTVVLLDSRHCDDGAPTVDGICNAHRNLPKWMRHHVKNLQKNRRGVGGMHQYLSSSSDGKFINGGWPGLGHEMKRFFREAKPFAESVLADQNAKFAKAQERDQNASGRKFNSKTGTWSSSVTIKSAGNSTATDATSSKPSAKPEAQQQKKHFKTEPPSSDGATSSSSSPKAAVAAPASAPPPALASQNGPPSTASEAAVRSTPSAVSTNPPQYLTSRERLQRALPKKKPPQNTLQAMFHRQRSTVAESVTATPLAPPTVTQYPHHAQQQMSQLTSTSPATGTNLDSALMGTTGQASMSQKDENEDNLCIICEEETKRVVLLPCKHLCVCSGCSKLEKLVDCPMCRTKILDKMEVFL